MKLTLKDLTNKKPTETKPALKTGLSLNLAQARADAKKDAKETISKIATVVKETQESEAAQQIATTEEVEAPRTLMSGESPATEKVVEISPDLEEQQKRFLENFNRIPSIIGDPDVLGAVMEDIMNELQANPDYEDFMTDACGQAMMRGLTETFRTVKASKAASSKSKGTRKKPTSAKTEEVDKLVSQIKVGDDGKVDLDSLMNVSLM